MKSSDFRRSFASLEEQTVVTVHGHPIGTWTPGPPEPPTIPLAASEIERRTAPPLHPFGYSRPAPKPLKKR